MSHKQRIQRYTTPMPWPLDDCNRTGCCCLQQRMMQCTTPHAINTTHHCPSHDLMDDLGYIPYLEDQPYCLPTVYNIQNEYLNDGIVYQVLYDDDELPTLIVQHLPCMDVCLHCGSLDYSDAEAADDELSGMLIISTMNNSQKCNCNAKDCLSAKDYEDISAESDENMPEQMPPNTYRAKEGYLVEEPAEDDDPGSSQARQQHFAN